MDESKNLSKVYDPKQVEEHWYSIWEENKYFAGRMDEGKENFSIVMPPPNVTGKLHMGHAMDNTMQDILVRYKRLCGFNTLWVPGTDHAGIATQAKVEAQLKEEGTNRFEVGREEFLRRTWAWKEEYGNTITTQLRKLGSSCDWDRERFTMDEGCSKAVREAFVRLYDKGLIYQGNYIVNWCPHCQTTISDIEVDHVDQEGKIYYFRYPTEDGTDSIEIATTRPETMMGDTAVAVHPEDERYKHLIGKNLVLPVVNRIIPVVADEYVEKDFGTGAVKITPAHDPNDFEVGSRHNLPQVFVIDKQGKMNNNAGKYAGLDRYECRKQLVEDLTAEGILTKIEDHNNSVGHCYRCNTVIEPLVSKQWFVKMEPLAKPAIEAAHTGAVNFVPERFTKIYLGWLENIRDWCISRQLWWGHRIPVWYCQDCGEVMCSTTDIDTCTKCGSKNVEQDPDVLDTWFSSGLWPFSTMGWPEQTKELEAFYPTSVLVTGRDIIFFWVARMLFDALEFTGQSPFHDVLIHGLVLDSQGRKMSKSLGNGVDPLDVVNDMGADILRLWVSSADYRNDIAVSQGILKQVSEAYRKMRNTFRYLLGNVSDFNYNTDKVALQDMEELDQWIVMKLHKLLEKVNKGYEDCEFHVVYHAVHNFCNVDLSAYYVDIVKDRLYCEEVDSKARRSCQTALYEILVALTQVMTPIISFTTEEVWKYLPKEDKELSVQLSGWPQVNPEAINDALDAKWDNILAVRGEVTKKLEEKRAAKEIGKALDAQVMLYAEGETYELLTQMADQLATIFIVSQVSVKPLSEAPADAYVSESVKGLAVEIAQAAGAICERCWIHSETLDENGLCPRCARVMAAKAE